MTVIALKANNTYVKVGRPWYDTIRGIKSQIKTLEDFLHLRHERHVAGYERGEKLNEFFVLGNY